MFLGIDCGSKTLGLALSYGKLARTYKTIHFQTLCFEKTFPVLLEIIKKNNIKIIVVGYPITMDNKISQTTKMVISFYEKLKQVIPENIFLIFHDERLSTKEANELLIDYRISKKK
jgi:putative transcription antitermination factor YqgF